MRILTRLALLACACSASEPTTETNSGDEAVANEVEIEEAADETARIAEVPFAAAEIHRATPPGRVYVVEMREGQDEPRRERWTFEQSNAEGFLLVVRDDEGTELRRSEGPWTELESHAHFPAEMTTIERTELESDLGRLACRLYVVRDEDDATLVRRFWFADDLPGAPVRMQVESAGTIVMEMRIVEHRPGS